MKKYFLLLCLFSTIIQAQQNLWWMSNKSRVNPELPYGSVAFNGVNQSITASGSGNFDPSSSTWTLEYWMYCSGTISSYVVGKLADGTESFYIQCLGTSWKIGDTADKLTCTQTLATNTWHHIALVCNSGTLKFYINGTQVATGANTLVSNTIANFTIGARSAAFMNGNISSFRLVTGTAVYTTTPFSLPTNLPSALEGTQLLLKTSYNIDNNFTDSSLNTFAVTNNNTATCSRLNPFVGSTYFNGGSIKPTVLAADAIGTSAFTVECWFNLAAINAGNHIISGIQGSSFDLYAITNTLSYTNGTGGILYGVSISLLPNTWYHVAIVRDASYNIKLYLNGALMNGSGVLTDTRNLSSTTFYIGTKSNAANPINGRVSNFRYAKEVLYNGNFTPSFLPLQATTETRLLIPFANGSLLKDYSKFKNTLTTTNVNSTTSVIDNPFGL